jgi:hypothetical protein
MASTTACASYVLAGAWAPYIDITFREFLFCTKATGRLPPPDSRQGHDLRDDFDLTGLLKPLALPGGIEPLFQP